MLKKKSQSSLEFLMIFGIGFTIILILSAIFFNYFVGEKDTLDKKHIDNLGTELIQNIEKVYYLGAGNRITINTNFPEFVNNLTIVHKINPVPFDYIVINVSGNGGHDELSFATNEAYIRFNCSKCNYDSTTNISYFNASDFSVGNKKIRIESKGDYVDISFVR